MMFEDNYFDDNSTVVATGATLTPTKLLLESATQSDFYMNELYSFDQNMFNTKVNNSTHMVPLPDNLVYNQQKPAALDVNQDLSKKQRKRLLEKNREAAHRCRQKKKRYMSDLEERSKTLEEQNIELAEQVGKLKEQSIYLRNLILSHGNCECQGMQSYLRRTSAQLSSFYLDSNPVNGFTENAS